MLTQNTSAIEQSKQLKGDCDEDSEFLAVPTWGAELASVLTVRLHPARSRFTHTLSNRTPVVTILNVFVSVATFYKQKSINLKFY